MDKEKIAKILTKEIPKDQIFIDESMKKHTSFKIGGPVDIFMKAKKIDELKYIIEVYQKQDIKLNIIGNGSNILVKDRGIRGIVVKLEFNDISIDNNIVTVGCGVKIGTLSQILLQEGMTGFEFAYGIPGTIGGALKMNAGAYGSEMKDIVIETKCIDLENYGKKVVKTYVDDIEIIHEFKGNKTPSTIILNNREQDFSYRHSIFMEKNYIILETKLKLKYGNIDEINEKMQNNLNSRKEDQPLDFPSAGSTFKRGEDYITSKLIDECNLKGYQIGGAAVSEKHAGFIINKDNATASDVIQLIDYVKQTVYEKTGKNIQLEIEILGE